MNKFTTTCLAFITGFLIFLILGISTYAQAAGTIINSTFSQAIQTQDKTAIFFDGQTQTTIESFVFNINPINSLAFYWITATPSKPVITRIDTETFVELEKLTRKKITKDNLFKKLLYFDITEINPPPQVYARPLDITNFTIIDPENQLAKLDAVLNVGGYFIPKKGRQILQEYADHGWYFVAAKINADHLQLQATDSLTITGAQVLPLMITFNTNKLVYPLRIASIQPDYDSSYAPYSYDYGSSSEQVLGEKDDAVDLSLSTPSLNEFPQLPLDFVNLHLDTYIFADNKVHLSGFTPIFTGWVNTSKLEFKDINDEKYFSPPKDKMFLTRSYAFKPYIQLEDEEIVVINNYHNVNTYSSLPLQYAKVLFLLIAVVGTTYTLLRVFYVKKG